MSEEILKVEKSRTGIGSSVSATVNVFSDAYPKPGDVTVSKTSSTGYEEYVSVGTPTSFVAYSSLSDYEWKATFAVYVADLKGWPVGSVSPVVVLSVYNADGVFIGTVEVTLSTISTYLVAPASVTFVHPDFGKG
jgi:hypothetical protein